jgi:hypothetical protein
MHVAFYISAGFWYIPLYPTTSSSSEMRMVVDAISGSEFRADDYYEFSVPRCSQI